MAQLSHSRYVAQPARLAQPEPQTINQIMCALRFFYGTTLGMADAAAQIPLARRSDPLPVSLSRDEVARFLKAIATRRA